MGRPPEAAGPGSVGSCRAMNGRRGLLVAVLVAAVAGTAPARDVAAEGEAARPPPPAPKDNSSYVPSDSKEQVAAFEALDKAAAARDWPALARAAQTIVEGPVAWVQASGGDGVYEGAFLVAQRRVVGLGAAAMAAYENEFGARAQAAFEAAARSRDLDGLADASTRWLPTAAGRRALLLLADVAIERGDEDDALGRLERLEDLEEAAAPDLAAQVATWRTARLEREAVLRAASRESLPRVRAWLEAASRTPARAQDLRPAVRPTDWPTTGGDASRAALPAALGPDLSFGWIEDLFDLGAGSERSAGTDARTGRGREVRRPSLWLPPRAAVVGERAYVSTGATLRAYQLSTGLLATDPFPLGTATRPESGLDARRHWGLLEGFALTAVGDVVYASVPRDRRHGPEGEGREGGVDAISAVDFGNGAPKELWRTDGEPAPRGVPRGMDLQGAPCVYRGSLWVAGTQVTKATDDRYEAWLLALDPATGAVTKAVFLGAGGPIRRKRGRDEVVATSCAAARGRVVVVTSLGITAAVDAASGRTEWSFRYPRGRRGGEDPDKRLEDEPEQDERSTTFANEPPLLCGGRCFFAPTDARLLFATADRPRGPRRLLRLWLKDGTEDFQNLAVEHLVGATDGLDGGPALLVAVGQGFRAPGEMETCVVALDAEHGGSIVWSRALPTDALQEPYGRAVMTRGEVYVSTSRGIARYRLEDGQDLPFLGPEALPGDAAALSSAELPYGNLVVAPGRGVLATSDARVAWWPARKRAATPGK